METNTIFYLIITFVITSLLWFIYITKLKSRYSNLENNYNNLNSNLDKEVVIKSDGTHKALQNTIADLKVQISDIKHTSFREGYDKARSEFSIKVFPYREEHKQGDNGFFVNDIYLEVIVGYQYQLFLNGIPILQPAIVVEEVLAEQKKEVDYNKVTIALEAIEAKLLPMVASSQGLLKYIKNK